jgi:hypothetical protein
MSVSIRKGLGKFFQNPRPAATLAQYRHNQSLFNLEDQGALQKFNFTHPLGQDQI